MRNPRLNEAQAGLKIARSINNVRYVGDTTLMVESKEKLNNLLTKVKAESDKPGLKLIIQKTKIMAYRLITSWQADGETMETMIDLFSWAPKSLQMVTASHEI